jgi:hypothetical protein
LPQFIIGRCSRSWSWASDCHCAGMAVWMLVTKQTRPPGHYCRNLHLCRICSD